MKMVGVSGKAIDIMGWYIIVCNFEYVCMLCIRGRDLVRDGYLGIRGRDLLRDGYLCIRGRD